MGRILIGKVTHPLKDNLETTEPGQGSLDAHQGKTLKGLIDSLGLSVGDLTTLQTTDKDSLVNAINNLAEAVSTLNSKMADTGWQSAGSGVSYRKKNGIVCVVGESITITIPANIYTTVGTLPEGARPAKNYPFFVDASGIETLIVGRLRTNGQIQIYSKKETTYWNFSISFPV